MPGVLLAGLLLSALAAVRSSADGAQPIERSDAGDAAAGETAAGDAAAADSATAAPAASIWILAPSEPALPVDAVRGRALYLEHCRICHGERGSGDGPAARFLEPSPRDFTRGSFKWRSTPSGCPPSGADLLASISHGAAGTAMPAFSTMPEADRWQLVFHLQSFARGADKAHPREREVLAPVVPPDADKVTLARGRDAWHRLKCSDCHGDDARGAGPATATLRDDRGRPAPVSNLHRAESYRAGCAPLSIYRTLATGLDGTPMPSYAAAAPRGDLLALAVLLRSLVATPDRCGSGVR